MDERDAREIILTLIFRTMFFKQGEIVISSVSFGKFLPHIGPISLLQPQGMDDRRERRERET
jgi:hypothetical protein